MNLKHITSPWFVLLVGLPGSGKSTLANSHGLLQNFPILSTDDHIENMAKLKGLTYNEVFWDEIQNAHKYMDDDLKESLAVSANIILDQTNLTVKKRTKILNLVPNHYYKLCIVVNCEPKELIERLSNRPGKVIPDHVLNMMMEFFETPNDSEKFDDILYYNTSSNPITV